MYLLRNMPASARITSQIAHTRMHVLDAWQHTRGAAAFPIAIIGAGIDLARFPELASARNAITGWDVVAGTSDVFADASKERWSSYASVTIVGNGSGDGWWGVAHDARLIHIKWEPTAASAVRYWSDVGTQANLAAAIRKAVELGARVVCCPQSYSAFDVGLQSACADAWSAGCLIVASSGDQNGIAPSYPSEFPNVVCVGAGLATDEAMGMLYEGQYGGKALFTGRYGSRVDVTGLGFETSSGVQGSGNMVPVGATVTHNPYLPYGPGRAVVAVAGVAHLIWAANPSLTNAQVRDILCSEVRKSGRGWLYYGFFPKPGRVGFPDAERAVMRAKSLGDPASVFPYLRIHAGEDDRWSIGDMWSVAGSCRIVRRSVEPDGTSIRYSTHGRIALEIGGYLDGDQVASVELWINGERVYAGPPTSTWDGNMPVIEGYRQSIWDLRVVASAASGATATRTYETPISADPATAPLSALTYELLPTTDLSGAAGGHAGASAKPNPLLAGAAAGQASASGVDPANAKLVGSAAGDAEAVATTQTQPPMGGAAAGHAGAVATISFVTPAASRVFTLTAGDGSVITFTTRPLALQGSDGRPLGFEIAPTGYYGPAVQLVGSAVGHAGATALPGVVQGLAGAASGHASAQGASTLQGLGGAATGHASGSALLAQEQPLAGTAAGAAGATATGPQTPIPLVGAAEGQSGATGDISNVPLGGHADGHAGATAAVAQTQALTGAAEGKASAKLVRSIAIPADGFLIARQERVGQIAAVIAAGELATLHRVGTRCGMANQVVFLGDDEDIYFVAKDANGKAIDLTGAEVFCDVQLVTGGTVISSDAFQIDDALQGKCRTRFSSDTTAAFTDGEEYRYDGRVKTSDGLRFTIGTGTFRAKAPITPTP